jgi:CBS domain-containing protein
MKVSEAMTRDVRIVNPGDNLESAAKIMAAQDLGFLPVGENDRLVGTITDRDIVVRGIELPRSEPRSKKKAVPELTPNCI